MSHIVTIQTQVRDAAAIQSACQRLSLPEPTYGTETLFSSAVTGWVVRLPDWQYAIVCDTDRGELHYDNYEGRWGSPKCLDLFLQAYAVEKTKLEARRQGRFAVERALPDGSIKLTIQVEA